MKILEVPSPHMNERLLPINSIIIHYTDMPTAEQALAWLSNPASNVSSHYLIDEKGCIYQLIPEDKRAWHAGESYWQGCSDLNSCSIGIELANPGHRYGYLPFPDPQIEALMRLCQDIMTRWDIPASRILGHSDIAPRRKQDPGHLFPWETLAREGLGLWLPFFSCHPRESEDPANDWISAYAGMTLEGSPNKASSNAKSISLTEALNKIGYETVSPTHSLLAFQRHFQPHKVDGVADEETVSLLQALLNLQNKHI
ncbi:MAG: N-acetylmuramoyl-L-alanine amidase [Proteobacteria bacterium]|nr:N-acetylmuramoyl-L-alanine amidase [Pseudomonadota bacterium]